MSAKNPETENGTRRSSEPMPRFFARGPLQVVAGLVTGLALFVGFPDVSWSMFIWFALTPLLLFTRCASPRRSFLLWFLAGAIFYGWGLEWLFRLSLVGGVIVVGVMAGYMGLFGWCVPRLVRFGFFRSPWLLGCAWVALDLVRSRFLGGFPWLSLGHALIEFPRVIQVADLGGVYLVSFLPVVFSGYLSEVVAELLRGDQRAKRRAIRGAAVAVALVISATIYGSIRLATITLVPGPRVAAIQASIDPYGKHGGFTQREIYLRHHGLSHRAAKEGADLIVWSETMGPRVSSADPRSHDQILALTREYGTPVVMGVEATEPRPGGGDPLNYNRAVFLRPDGVIDSSDKVNLVPFGEYIPFRSLLPMKDAWEGEVREKMGRIPDMSSGTRTPLFELPVSSGETYRFGALICYDSLFAPLLRKFDLKQADFFVNLSNDGWYAGTAEPRQILEMTVFRAVEYRVAMFRATNLGYSASIAPTGDYEVLPVPDPLRPPHEGGVALTAELLLTGASSVYAGVGDLFAWGCVLVLLTVLLAGLRRK